MDLLLNILGVLGTFLAAVVVYGIAATICVCGAALLTALIFDGPCR